MSQELMMPYQARNVNAELGSMQDHQLNNPHLPHLFPTEYHSPHSLGLSDLAFLAQAQAAAAAVGGWVEIDRTTLVSPADDITVSGLADKRYYMVLVDKQTTGNSDGNIRLGNGSADAGNNYTQRLNNNGGIDATGINIAQIQADLGGRNTPAFAVGYLGNLSAKEKLWLSHATGQSTAGSATVPERSENVGLHAQTSNPNDVIQAHNINAGSFNTGAEVVVLGWDPADIHTNNFWEELSSVDLSSAGFLDTGTITAKKYLMIQYYAIVEDRGNVNLSLRFNDDSATNYSIRKSQNGAADTIETTQSQNSLIVSGGKRYFGTIFVLNNSGQEKIWTGHQVAQGIASDDDGSGAPPRRWEFGGKWITSGQITDIQFRDLNATSEFLLSGSKLRVFGAN